MENEKGARRGNMREMLRLNRLNTRNRENETCEGCKEEKIMFIKNTAGIQIFMT